MSDKKGKFRRDVLKTTGITLGTISGASATAAARRRQHSKESDEPRREIIEETESYTIVKVTNVPSDQEKNNFIVKVDKDNKNVYKLDEAVRAQDLASGQRVYALDHDTWFEDYEVDYHVRGDCNGYLYDDHLVVGCAGRLGEKVDNDSTIWATAFGTLLGGLAGVRFGGQYGGPVGGFLGAISGWVIDSAYFQHQDFSGREFTLLFFDDHVGFWDKETIKMGGFSEFDASASPDRATSSPVGIGQDVDGANIHIELGRDIGQHL